jgi:Zn-dependent protease with chaperone function
MTAWLGFFWLLFLIVLATWAIAAVVATAISIIPERLRLQPEVRARRALLTALLPWAVPVIAVVSVFALAAAKPLGLIADHCIYHGPGHPHLCLQHLPAISMGHLHLLGAAIVLALLLLVVTRYLLRERRMIARLQVMQALAHGRGRLRILENEQCLALAANLRNPVVLLSRGLMERLTRRERRIVVGHEIAHLRHADLLRNYLFEFLLLLHIPSAAERLRASWRQALEERADDCVAQRYGADAVAGALLQIVRAPTRKFASALSVAGADPLRRIARLLAPREVVRRHLRFELSYAVVLLVFAVTVVATHHALETVVGVLTGG